MRSIYVQFIALAFLVFLSWNARAQVNFGEVTSGKIYRIYSTCGSGTKVMAISRNSLSDGANLVLADKNTTSSSQMFKIEVLDSGFLFTAQNSSKVWRIKDSSLASGAPLIQDTFVDGSLSRLFAIENPAVGIYRFRNLKSGLYVDLTGAKTSTGTKFQQYSSNSTCAQRFKLEEVGTSTSTTTTTTTTTLLSTTTTLAPPNAIGPYGQDPSLFTLTLQEEFDGTTLNTNMWTNHMWYDSSSDAQDYSVSNGSLKIWPALTSSGQFHNRYLTTKDHFYQTYGYFEMEAKLPIGKGVWPAFWLLNSDDVTNGAEPEIDIMEAYSGDTGGYYADSNFHPIRTEATYYQNGAGQPGLSAQQSLYTGDLSTGFHKYALSWEPGYLNFYFDGVLFFRAAVSMSKRMYIILDIMYGSASGQPDSSTPTGPGNSYEIRYVRVWQKK